MSPTNVRYAILAVTTLAAIVMYLDRIFLNWMLTSESFQAEITLSEDSQRAIKEAFFWAYALAQVPAALLAERYGKRALMTVMILSWSGFTVLTGCADGFWLLLFARLGCGVAQAGAFPVAGSLLSHWAHFQWRAVASSVVSLGGRIGLALTPALTAMVIAQTGSWRWSGWLFGGVGIFVAAAFGWIFRETPAEHPFCNAAERSYLAEGHTTVKKSGPTPFPWLYVLTDGSLWLMCAVQFLTNFGWAFLANSLSNYLKEVHHTTDAYNGWLSTTTLLIGMFGLLAGGLVTDLCTRKFGVRLGRMIPLVGTRFLAGAMFLLCLVMPDLWSVVILLGLMAFTADAGLPSMWAFAQDVGGRRVASILGWANMWGNFGAALQANWISKWLRENDLNHDYQENFWVSGLAFILAGFLALGINAARPVDRSESDS